MEAMLQWGLDCIRAIQAHANVPFNMIMWLVTELGSSYAYLMILPFLFWCIDEKKCIKLAAAVLISGWVNVALKLLLDQPRPFFALYDPLVDILHIEEELGGLPSGHAQNSLVMWIIIASWSKKKWAYPAAGFLCLLIGFSRMYLGMHFPTDVFAGWIIAGIILCGYFLLSGWIEALLAKRSPRAGVLASAVLAFLMILYQPSADVAILKSLFMPAAMILGLGTGYFLCRRYINFSASSYSGKTGAAKYLNLSLRFLLGITVMVLLYVASGKLVNLVIETSNYRIFIFLRYAFVAVWVSAGAPALFRLLRLADDSSENVIHYQEND